MLPDPLASRAVLVGAGTFSTLEPLPAVANNLRHLAELLTDPAVWGLPESHCTVVAEPGSADDVLDALHDATRDAHDALLFYYAGHGLMEPDTFELYLTLPRTNPAPVHGAVRFEDVRRLVAGARRCRSKVVILDCCYSGLALSGAMSDPATVADRVVVNNSYVLTAAAETALAYAPPDEEFTAFTGELVTILRDGLPNGADVLEMEAVYWQLAAELSAKRRPMPQARARNDGHAIAIARNRATRSPPPAAAPRAAAAPTYTTAGRGLNPARLIALLADPPAGVTATDLLVAAASSRPTQEVAALAYAMRAHPAAGVLLEAAGRRAPQTVGALVTDLDELGLRDVAERLVRSAATGDGRRVVELGPLLGDWQATLLDAAVQDRVGRPAAMIALIGALWTSPLRSSAEAALRRVSASMPPADAAALADALRDGGHEVPAFHLYEVAADTVAARSPAAVVDLAAAMFRAGHERQGLDLVDLAVQACTTAPAAAEILYALRLAGHPPAGPDRPADPDPQVPTADRATALAHRLGLAGRAPADRGGPPPAPHPLAGAADRAMHRLAAGLPDPDLLALADLLRAGPEPDDALRVLQLAAGRRPAASTIAYLTHLHDAGRPIDANRLLERHATGLSGGDLATVAVAAAAAGPDVAVRRVLSGAVAGDPDRVAELVAGLHRAGGGADLARHTDGEVAALSLPVVAAVAVRLVGLGDTTTARELLHARHARLFTEPLAVLDTLLHGRRAQLRSDKRMDAVADVVVAVVCVHPDLAADPFVTAFLADDATFRWDLAECLVGGPPGAAVAFFARLGPQVRSGCHRDYATVAARHSPPQLPAMFAAIRDLLPGHVLFDFLAAVGAQSSVDDLVAFVDDLVDLGTAPEQFRPLLRAPAPAAGCVLAARVAHTHPHLAGVLPFPVYGTPPSAVHITVVRTLLDTFGPRVLPPPGPATLRLEPGETPLFVWPLAKDGLLAFTDRAVHHMWPARRPGYSTLAYDDLPAARLHVSGRFDLRVVVQVYTDSITHDWRLEPAGAMAGGEAALTAERLAEALNRARAAVNGVLAVRTGERPAVP